MKYEPNSMFHCLFQCLIEISAEDKIHYVTHTGATVVNFNNGKFSDHCEITDMSYQGFVFSIPIVIRFYFVVPCKYFCSFHIMMCCLHYLYSTSPTVQWFFHHQVYKCSTEQVHIMIYIHTVMQCISDWILAMFWGMLVIFNHPKPFEMMSKGSDLCFLLVLTPTGTISADVILIIKLTRD